MEANNPPLQLISKISSRFRWNFKFHLGISAKTTMELKDKLEMEAENILAFMASNGLCANPSKTGLLVHRPKSIVNVPLEISVTGSRINESTSQKLLGIEISSDLVWSDHLKKLEEKIRMGITMIKRLKAKLPKVNMNAILQGLVVSHIRYGCSVDKTAEVLDKDLN